MAVEVEIIQPEGFQAEPDHLESSDAVTTGNPLAGYAAAFLGLLVAAVFLGSVIGADDEPLIEEQSTTTLAPRDAEETDSRPSTVADGGHSAERQARRTTITEWNGGQSVFVVENSQFIYELDLATGRRTSWAPPELLIEADPLVVGDQIVVVGETGAWIGVPFTPGWRLLGGANRVMPSTTEGRFWLQYDIPVSDAQAANFEWTEVDATGTVFRTVTRDAPVELANPEVVISSEGAIVLGRRTVSNAGSVLASGVNDVVAAVCDSNDVCERVWFDPATSRRKTGFYPDLAQNVDARFGALLSPDGRFVASRAAADRSDIHIESVVTGRSIDNSCIWGQPLVWSGGSELVACATPTGAELISTEDGESLGQVVVGSEKWARMVFMPTATIGQSR